MVAIFITFLEFTKRTNRLLGRVVIVLMLTGCSLPDRVAVLSTQGDYSPFQRVAVLTFQHVPADAVSAKAPKIANARADALPDRTDPEVARIIQEIFHLKVQGRPGYYFVDEVELGRIYKKIAPEGFPEEDRASFFRSLAKELNVDGLITGNVYRYRDRLGRSYSAQYPASVAFEIGLVSAGDGTLVWRGIFDKTQKSLLENLLDISSFYRQRGRWVTARELAEEGMEDIIQRIPVFR